MATINSNYRKLPESYFFLEIAKKVKAYADAHPGVELYKLGIGNTTEPLVPAVIEGLRGGVEKLANVETYTGYGDEQGDKRLRDAVRSWYASRGIQVDMADVFISDGAKADCANITSIFSHSSVVAVSDPVYPVYVDASILSGKRVIYMDALPENNFLPSVPNEKADIIFLCSPNNPTGAVATKGKLKEFVDYAHTNKSVIIFDAAYSEYIRDKNLPRSIYEIDGAKECAIEIQSFSKAAGFTGVRLGWTIVPKELAVSDSQQGELNKMWNRRQTTMFNGASNIVQEGGLAVLSAQGQTQTHAQIDYYMENARIIKEGLTKCGFTVYGAENAPYVWVKSSKQQSSWDFFDELLDKAHVITVPGVGFGKNGEGYLRLSAFGHRENIQQAVDSIVKAFAV